MTHVWIARDHSQWELDFRMRLDELVPGLDYWIRGDADDPWMCVSLDLAIDNQIVDTLRLDVDAKGIRGGWSPANLNWDDGVRAEDAEIDIDGRDGINEQAAGRSADELASIAAQWFLDHQRRWSAPG